MKKPVIIGIAGGSASGKTSIAQELYDCFKGRHTIRIIKLDDYYKDQTHLSMDKRVLTNYDHPLAFDMDLLIEHLDLLKEGKSIQKPTYDFEQHNRSKIVEIVDCRDVFILEGLFVLNEVRIRERCDILVYVDTDADIRFIRRLRRDLAESGFGMYTIFNNSKTNARTIC